MEGTILSKIMALNRMSIKELQKKYEEIFNGQRAASNNKVYLLRRIAYRLQELEYGGLSEKAQLRVKEIMEECDPLNKIFRSNGNCVEKIRASGGRQGILRDKRLPIPGTIIKREYKGNLIEVEVLENGFQYKGRKYGSLSAIAKEITGAHWNGYLFFNL